MHVMCAHRYRSCALLASYLAVAKKLGHLAASFMNVLRIAFFCKAPTVNIDSGNPALSSSTGLNVNKHSDRS